MPERSRRIFFAVWPDETTAAALHDAGREARRACGGRLMRQETLHLTLAFLGDVPESRLADARAAADGVVVAPLALSVDRLGWWPRNRILWAGGECALLAALAESLCGKLREADFRLEERPFAAHVTLLRDARCRAAPKLVAPFDWPVAEFVLAESVHSAEGARYEAIGRWGLRRET